MLSWIRNVNVLRIRTLEWTVAKVEEFMFEVDLELHWKTDRIWDLRVEYQT